MGRGLERRRDFQEEEANLFAFCLLMPAELVAKEIGKPEDFDGLDPCDDSKVIRLAKTFAVTVSFVVIRLAQLGYIKPVGFQGGIKR